MTTPACKLSDDRIEIIRKEVRQSNLSLPGLEDELIDHLCCLVEDAMGAGCSFEEAYRNVKRNIPFESLKDIELQTLMLIDKKFDSMKRTLKISGLAGLVLVFLGSVLRVIRFPGGGPLLTLGVLILALGYLPALLLTLKKEKLLRRKRQLALTGIIASFSLLVSLLFAQMSWPLTGYVQLISWLFVLVFLVLLYGHIIRSEDNRVLNLSLLLFLVVLFLLNTTQYLKDLGNPKKEFYTYETSLPAGIRLFEQGSSTLYRQVSSTQANRYTQELQELKSRSDGIVALTVQMRDRLFNSREEQSRYVSRLFKPRVLTEKLESTAMQLGQEVERYHDFLLGLPAVTPALRDFIESSLRYGAYDFNNAPPISYNNLDRLIRDVRIAEYEMAMALIYR